MATALSVLWGGEMGDAPGTFARAGVPVATTIEITASAALQRTRMAKTSHHRARPARGLTLIIEQSGTAFPYPGRAMFLLLALFIIVPLLELYVIIQVGQAIGIWWTLLVLVLDSILGARLMRTQGRAA